MKSKQCRLVGTIFLGAIVVAVGSESVKKRTLDKSRRKSRTKNGWREENGQPRVFIDVRISVASPR